MLNDGNNDFQCMKQRARYLVEKTMKSLLDWSTLSFGSDYVNRFTTLASLFSKVS